MSFCSKASELKRIAVETLGAALAGVEEAQRVLSVVGKDGGKNRLCQRGD
jgi:hypothetical protein